MRFKIETDEIEIYQNQILGFQLIYGFNRQFEEFDGFRHQLMSKND
jgi:hypothetical protein